MKPKKDLQDSYWLSWKILFHNFILITRFRYIHIFRNMIGLLLAIIVFFFVFDIDAAVAQDRLKLQYSLDLEERYNDNIFLSATEETADSITFVMPALAVIYPMRTSQVSLNYNLKGFFYAKNKEQNDLIHTVTSHGAFTFFQRTLNLEVDDRYIQRPVNNRQFLIYGYNPGAPLLPVENIPPSLYKEMTYANILSITPQLKLRPGPLTNIDIGYGYSRTDYRDPTGVENQTHLAFFSVEKNLNSSLTGGGAYRFSRTIYTLGTLNSRENVFSSFIDYKPLQSTLLRANVGYALLTYKNTITWSVDFTHQFTREVSATLNSSSFNNNYTEGTVWHSKAVGLSVKYDIDKFLRISGSGSYRVDTGTIDFLNKNIVWDMRGSAIWFVQKDISLSASTFYSETRFKPTDEKDAFLSEDVNCSYHFRPWLSIGASYQHFQKRSDTLSDFENNIYSISIKGQSL